VAFIIVLGITITFHEFGHFAMAKLLKIRVLVFSLGFGPRLAGFTRSGTEYRLSPIPLGGYVKMAGEAFDDDRKGAPDEFLSHPKWHRFLVAVSGPFMNIFLAVMIFTYSYMQGVYIPKYPKEPAVIGPVAANSIARQSGLQTGDRILSVHGNTVNTWEDMEIALGTAPKDSLDVEVERNGRKLQIHFNAPKSSQVDPLILGFRYFLTRTIVAEVEDKSPAGKAGLREGDEILSVEGNGKTGKDYNQILNLISESKGIPLNFTVLRPDLVVKGNDVWQIQKQSGKLLNLTITPIENKGRVVIGFSPDIPASHEKFGPVDAFMQSVRKNYEVSFLTFKIIGRIIKGSASVRTISGPIEIARMSGSAASSGSALYFLEFLGLVSLQLGVFNLLPIPILDGGVIALLLIEGLMRRELSLSLKEKIVQVGFVFLIILTGFVVFNDLSKIVDFNRIFR
jgi:regulator of sigma E protease